LRLDLEPLLLKFIERVKSDRLFFERLFQDTLLRAELVADGHDSDLRLLAQLADLVLELLLRLLALFLKTQDPIYIHCAGVSKVLTSVCSARYVSSRYVPSVPLYSVICAVVLRE
jgi:hypothetical protein